MRGQVKPQLKTGRKEVRKPVADQFAPKRLAINFEPPTIVMEYLVLDSGKLYHHKMRLDSILRKPGVNRLEVLDYIKNKHHLYFVGGKVKDAQLLKFIDKVLARTLKSSLSLIKEQNKPNSPYQNDDDFDYLHDDEYEEDYEDYEEEPQPKSKPKKETAGLAAMFNKNTFMTYCQEYEQGNEEEEPAADWDLDMDASADFV